MTVIGLLIAKAKGRTRYVGMARLADATSKMGDNLWLKDRTADNKMERFVPSSDWGYFAQMSILPAFSHAKKNSELAALISGDPAKLKKLGAKYGVQQRGSYGEFEDCLEKANVDAVYLALPNSLHREFTIRAARAGTPRPLRKAHGRYRKRMRRDDSRVQ